MSYHCPKLYGLSKNNLNFVYFQAFFPFFLQFHFHLNWWSIFLRKDHFKVKSKVILLNKNKSPQLSQHHVFCYQILSDFLKFLNSIYWILENFHIHWFLHLWYLLRIFNYYTCRCLLFHTIFLDNSIFLKLFYQTNIHQGQLCMHWYHAHASNSFLYSTRTRFYRMLDIHQFRQMGPIYFKICLKNGYILLVR